MYTPPELELLGYAIDNGRVACLPDDNRSAVGRQRLSKGARLRWPPALVPEPVRYRPAPRQRFAS